MAKFSDELIKAAALVKNKRASLVIKHIIRYGHVTTEEIETKYGYGHAPRAACDVKEAGIPIKSIRVKGSTGKSIASYTFGDPSKIDKHKLEGRRTFSKAFKELLVKRSSSSCEICGCVYEKRYLQIDHAIPYGVAGDDVGKEAQPEMFLLICASCQRSKSWSCEHCSCWADKSKKAICKSCYWANPKGYTHLATVPHSRLDIVWKGDESDQYKRLKLIAVKENISISDAVKRYLTLPA